MTEVYVATFSSVGNPDFRQFAPVSDPVHATATSLEDLQKQAREYISEWELGGGNWPPTVVTHAGEAIGEISYNGRFQTTEEVEVEREGLRRAFAGTEHLYGSPPCTCGGERVNRDCLPTCAAYQPPSETCPNGHAAVYVTANPMEVVGGGAPLERRRCRRCDYDVLVERP